MIGFGQDIEIPKVNEKMYIYKHQNFIDAVNEITKLSVFSTKRAALMYLLAVENSSHYPDILKGIDIEIVSNEQLIVIKEVLESDYEKFLKIHQNIDRESYERALEMF